MIPSPVISYATKIDVTAVMVVLIAETGKRNTLAASILASLPLTSVLALLWLYWDTKNTAQVASLSHGIFWLVLPSLVLFIALPWLIQKQMPFYQALALSCALTVASYFVMLKILSSLNITSG